MNSQSDLNSGGSTAKSHTDVSAPTYFVRDERNVKDTPRILRVSDTTNVHQKRLDNLRDMYLKELGPTIPEVTWDFFARAILPRVPVDKLEAICDAVNASPSLVLNNRWTAFSHNPSHKDMPSENVTFAVIPDIWNGVIEIAKAKLNKEPTSGMQSQPNKSMTSETSLGASFKADSVTTITRSRGAGTGPGWEISLGEHEVQPPSHTPQVSSSLASGERVLGQGSETQSEPSMLLSREAADATSLWEYKCKSTSKDVNSNIDKVISGASHVLHNDPSRRHTFGITIEDTQTRVWYFCRTAVFVSKSFDFMTKDRNWFIHLLVSLAFATDVEIGFDPTVERLVEWDKNGPTICYRLLVNDRWYRTIRILDNYRTSRVVGRATRVWEVRLDPDKANLTDEEKKKVFALKDVWMGETARSEKEIQDDICARANNVNVIEDFEPKFRERYFMDIVTDEVVTVDHRPDTFSENLGNISFPQDYGLFELEQGLCIPKLVPTLPGSQSNKPVGALVPDIPNLADRQPAEGAPLFEARQHRRILFWDVGIPLGDISDHQEFFSHLAHATKGLKHLYSAGYVHRDLSTGNLLVCNGKCKITDLEYAKPYERIDSRLTENAADHGFKTGTPAFMPIEILDGMYHFRPGRTRTATSTGVSRVAELIRNRRPALIQERKIVRHNYLHDIESLWWIAMYSLLTTFPTSDRDKEATNERLKYAASIFRNQLQSSNERRALLLEEETLEMLSKGRLPEGYKPVADFIIFAASLLIEAFSAFEKDMDAYPASEFGQVHSGVQLLFEQAVSVATKETTEHPGWRMREIEPKARGSKRKQDSKGKVEDTEASTSKRHKSGDE